MGGPRGGLVSTRGRGRRVLYLLRFRCCFAFFSVAKRRNLTSDAFLLLKQLTAQAALLGCTAAPNLVCFVPPIPAIPRFSSIYIKMK